jgi:hypothetical protein
MKIAVSGQLSAVSKGARVGTSARERNALPKANLSEPLSEGTNVERGKVAAEDKKLTADG